MKYSLSGFLFEENRTHQAISLDEFCALAARLGYDGVELRRTQVDPSASKADRRSVLETARAHGLAITCLTTRGMPSGGAERDEFFKDYLELCADLECGLLKTGGEPEWMYAAAGWAAAYNVVIARNNHVGSDIETVAGTREFLQSVVHPNVKLLYDSMHLYFCGEDYLAAVREFAPRIANVLVHSIRPPLRKDGARGNDMVVCMPDDPDSQDWVGIFQELQASGYGGLVTVIESGWPAAERESVAKRNIDYLTFITPA